MRAGSRAIGAAVTAAALVSGSAAHALTRQEAACQAAIGRAGKAFVAAELASQGRCKMQRTKGKVCDPSGKTTADRARLQKAIGRCGGVALAHLGGGSCAGSSNSMTALGTCLIDGHERAIASLLTDEFGLAAPESEVVISGRMAQAGASLVPPAHLVVRRAAGLHALAFADLTLSCVTFDEPTQSASTPIGAEGSFLLVLAAVGTPFGCSVVDTATGEQVATLVFRTAGGDAAQVQTGDRTLALGTVGLNLDTGEAVVDASGLGQRTVCKGGVTNPADFTGSWQFTCTPGPTGSGYACSNGGGPESIYLHRVPGTDADGHPKYWLGMWKSIAAFTSCGQVEGLASVPGGTTIPGGDTLGIPDGPFSFASESTVFGLIDAITMLSPGGPPPPGICNSTAAHCSGVQNGDGQPCVQPTPSTPSNCWGQPDLGTQPPPFVAFTDAECQQLCYQMNLYGFGAHSPQLDDVLVSNDLCVEEGLLDLSTGPANQNAIVRLGTPIGRFLLDTLQYSCDDAASVVHRFPTHVIGFQSAPGQAGPPTTCHVTQRAEIALKMTSAGKIVGSFKQSFSLTADDPAACADDSNPQNPIAAMIRNPVRMLFTLTR